MPEIPKHAQESNKLNSKSVIHGIPVFNIQAFSLPN